MNLMTLRHVLDHGTHDIVNAELITIARHQSEQAAVAS